MEWGCISTIEGMADSDTVIPAASAVGQEPAASRASGPTADSSITNYLRGRFRAVNQRGASVEIRGIDRRKQCFGEATQQVDERRRIVIAKCRDQLPLRGDDLRDHFIDQLHTPLRYLALKPPTVS